MNTILTDDNQTKQAHTILVVDDNPNNLQVIAGHLKELDYQILMARNGYDGIKRARHGHPHLILLDVMMPGIDGFETCRRLKASPETADIPVIFMTVLSETEHKIEAFNSGAVDYITKPIHFNELLARITIHIRIQTLSLRLQERNLQLETTTKKLKLANQKLAEQARAEKEKTLFLEELNANKDKFFSIVAHDLKAPFLPVLGNAELLVETTNTLNLPDVANMSLAIHRAAKRVLELLENLLHWSRIQMGRMSYEPTPLNLKHVVDQNIKLLTMNAKQKNITMRSNVETEITVYVDNNMLNTVIRNLISNAIKFTPSDGLIVISSQSVFSVYPPGNGDSSATNEFIELTITDNGIGMSTVDMKKLFQISVHHTTTGTANEKGTGLGLIMCNEMVQMNGGKIWVESVEGEGMSVKFTMPLAV